jgi:tetratricopeptide (TPR) repeat protein/transcriptional regulator with XRE-family HTH domain
VGVSASFGELLRRHRLEAGLTQAGLAELAELSEQAVSMLERGSRRRPRLETVRSLSSALGLDAAAEEELQDAARIRNAATVTAVDQTPPSIVPWQLPPTVADFTAREDELKSLLARLAQVQNASVRVVITGMGGIGKTALAVHAGHLSAGSFPDGQLYVKLRGYDPGAALTSAEALGQLLRSLGVRHEAIPTGVDEMASLYRSRMAGRRMLILLDDANSVDQVMPLLPGDNGSATIITSRRFLASLPGSLTIRLSALAEDDSVRLLSSVAGESRVWVEKSAAREISALTGGLPLALRLVGARLAARPNWLLQHIIDQLQDEHRRLDELGLDHSGVRASFAGSLDELIASPKAIDRDAAATFDLLSLAEGPELSVPLIARLLGKDESTTEYLLERLVDLHLLDSIGPRRYRMHDLLRTYAGERLSADSRTAERVAAIERGLRFYIAGAWKVHRITHPWSPRQPTEELDPTGVPDFADMPTGQAWIDTEYDSMIDLYRKAATVPALAERFGPSLALGLFGYLESRALWERMRSVYDLAIGSIDATTDPSTAAWVHHDRAIPDIEQGHLESGRGRLLQSLELFDEAQDLAGMARSCSSLCHVCERLGWIGEAIEWGERGLSLALKVGDQAVLGTSHLALGILYNRVGRYTDAEAAFQTTLELARSTGNTRFRARRHRVIAGSYFDRGLYDVGIEHLNASLALYQNHYDPIGISEALHHLSSARLALGQLDSAQQSAGEALRLAVEYNDTHREAAVLATLAEIREAQGDRTSAQDLRRQAITIYEADGMTPAATALRKLLNPHTS